jgi:hypothetical protein
MKPDGTWHPYPCGDYHPLNLVILLSFPNIQDLSSRLHGCGIFSKLDLRKGYYQIPVQEGDIHKTAVITPFSLWEFLRMPFGLRNAGQSFQRFMDKVLDWAGFRFLLPRHHSHRQHQPGGASPPPSPSSTVAAAVWAGAKHPELRVGLAGN